VAAVWVFYGTGERVGERITDDKPAIRPAVATVNTRLVSPPVVTIAAEDAQVAESAGGTDAQQGGLVPSPTVQKSTAERDDRPARPTEPSVTDVSSAVRHTVPMPAPPEEADKTPAAPSVVAYLPLRNTELADVEEAIVEPVRVKSLAGMSVKTPKSPAPRSVEQAQAAIAQGELSSAESILQRNLQLAPGDKESRELMVGLMLRGERYDAAMQQLDAGLKQHPGHVKLLLIKARLLAQYNEVAAAIKILESAPPSVIGRTERLQMLGALYQQQSRYDQAVDSYRELLQINPTAGPAWVGLAISLDGLGDDAALEAYGRALRFGGLPAAAESYARQRVSQLELTFE
jgi:Flp pilus assembly protein TadD